MLTYRPSGWLTPLAIDGATTYQVARVLGNKTVPTSLERQPLQRNAKEDEVDSTTSMGYCFSKGSNVPTAVCVAYRGNIPEHRVLILINRNVSFFVDFQGLEILLSFSTFFWRPAFL